MARLLCFARRDSLLPSLLDGVLPQARRVDLEVGDIDPLVAGDPPVLLVLEPAADPDWAAALATITSRRFPRCPALLVFRPEHHALALRARAASSAGVLLAEPFVLDEFRALVHDLVAPNANAAAAPQALGASPPYESTGAAPRDSAAPPPGVAGSAPPPHTASAGHAERVADLDALGMFVRGLAHEINNPLTTIRGLLQLRLHISDAADRDGAESLATMDREAQRIAEVIQELEYFTGLRRPARTLLEPARIVREALGACGLERITPRVDATARAILADREQLHLALRHMFGFVAHGAAEGVSPEVTVTNTRTDANGCVFDVAGRAPHGVALDAPERLLVPLYGGSGTDRLRRRSLATVYGIARAHGGTLQIERTGDRDVRLRLVVPGA